MEIFSIICLVIIMFVVQHLLNWFWRKTWKDDKFVSLFLAAFVTGITLSIFIIKLIIEWGKNLI